VCLPRLSRDDHWRARCWEIWHGGFGPGPLEKDLTRHLASGLPVRRRITQVTLAKLIPIAILAEHVLRAQQFRQPRGAAGSSSTWHCSRSVAIVHVTVTVRTD
jgi:hypothetical protein